MRADDAVLCMYTARANGNKSERCGSFWIETERMEQNMQSSP